MSSVEQNPLLVAKGEQALLKGDLEEANWALDTVLFLEPALAPCLWQRGLCLYYTRRYEEGMSQFERDMDANGGDVEEVLWHFFCKARLMGFEEARKSGFLPLCDPNDDTQSISPPPVPMLQVLALYQGQGSVEEVLKVATHSTSSKTVTSYNGANALGYAHFYIGLYYELQDLMELAHTHLKRAAEIGNEDYVGQLIRVHFEKFRRDFCQRSIRSYSSSQVIYGGWQLSTGHTLNAKDCPDQAEVITKLLAAIDQGVTVFDCGDIYTGVEQLYGRVLEAHVARGGKRGDIKINTKLVPDLDVVKRGGVDESYVRGIVRRSLNRLKTSYVDLVQFFLWEWSYAGCVEAIGVLRDLQREGVVRGIGLANYDVDLVLELVQANLNISTVQVQLSVLDHRPLHSGLVSACNEHNIKILAYGVLAGGFLTDQWIGQPQPHAFTNRSQIKYQLIIDEFGSWGLFQELLSVLRSIADRHSPMRVQLSPDDVTCVEHVTVAMVAIAYVSRISAVGGIITSSFSTSHLQEAIMATHLRLDDQDLQNIQFVVDKGRGPKGGVYALEQDQSGRHGSIMKYNLNQLNGPSHFEEICIRFLELFFSAHPTEATRTGYRYSIAESTSTKLRPSESTSDPHSKYAIRVLSYDHQLDIATKDQIRSYIERVRSLLAEVMETDTSVLSVDQNIDREVIIAQLNLELVKWLEVRQHEKDPSVYLPFDAINYLLPSWRPDHEKDCSKSTSDFFHPGVASLSPGQRLEALLSRLRRVPYLLQAGIENLSKPGRLFTERALKLCDSFGSFLKLDLPRLVQEMAVANSPLTEKVIHSALVASDAVTRYKESLQSMVMPIASDANLSLGKPVYDKLLKFSHFIEDSSTLLELGEKHFSLVKKQLEQLAQEIDPLKTWSEITEDVIRPMHPSAQELLPAYLSEIGRARKHMMELKLVPDLPEEEQVLGFYTPQFLVPFSPFGDFLNPVPFAVPVPSVAATSTQHASTNKAHSRTGYLMLHSVADKSLPPHEEEALLRAHDHSWISVIAPHECYPGHHVQALLTQQHPRVLRKFYECTYFYEGWGLYCEQLAYETGFFEREVNTSKECGFDSKLSSNAAIISKTEFAKMARLTQLRLQLWRAARVILDIKLHRGEMSYEECRAFLCKEVMFNSHSVDGELFMYVSRPTYAPCYVAGYVELMKLREKEKERCASEGKVFSLNEFHRKLLMIGCLPFPLIEKVI